METKEPCNERIHEYLAERCICPDCKEEHMRGDTPRYYRKHYHKDVCINCAKKWEEDNRQQTDRGPICE